MTKPIHDRVRPILRDPASGEHLRIEDESLVSDSHRYPIVNGVPRFVPSDQYVGSFSFEWNTHNNTQLDCFRGDKSSEDQFIQKTGFAESDLRGKLVLDAGVGAGRYADVVSRWGADVVGVDLSYAVDAAHQNFVDRPNVWIMQADIGKLPFKPESFDAIFSIGVLHHTPDTEAYFKTLVPLLKPGGAIAIWVYPNEGDYLVRKQWIRFVNKIPPRWFYKWCRWFVPWAQQRLDRPYVGILRRLFPFSSQGLGLENDILDTFDGYSPTYHWVHSPGEVEGWFRESGLKDIRRPSTWNTCVRGVKPIDGRR
ncbi:MAG: class I SAM-dependent methyltransferase [Nitrospiraceae bacterium]